MNGCVTYGIQDRLQFEAMEHAAGATAMLVSMLYSKFQ